jgi:hypothetical protein
MQETLNTEPCLLSTAYWPCLQYMTKFILHKDIFIEQHDHYCKQTYRNRCAIYGANGRLILSVPVVNSAAKMVMHEVLIDDKTSWQKNHLRSIESAYRNSPWFEYCFHELEQVLSKKHEGLLELNQDILLLICRWLKLDNLVRYTSAFHKEVPYYDYRDAIHPKPQVAASDESFTAEKYPQVFSDRLGFLPDLSILDLYFNLGPDTRDFLTSCTPRNKRKI